MTKRIVALVASLAVIIGLMNCGTSYAWFVSSSERKQSIAVALVSSTQSSYLTDLDGNENRIIMQGDNLVSLDNRGAVLRIDNNSNTDIQIRLKIEYTNCSEGISKQIVYSGENDDIDVAFTSDKWSKNVNGSGVCYFYYMGSEYKTETMDSLDAVPAIGPETPTIDAISKIAYKNTVSDYYLGQKINIKVTFECKQADNVTWSNIDTYSVDGVAK